MKRPLSLRPGPELALVVAGTSLVAGTYGLVRLAYGLFLPDVQASLGLSAATAGTISAGASIAYCVGALLGLGAAAHARRLVVGALATASLGAAGMALSPEVVVLAPTAVLASMGAGLASPGLVAVVARNVAAPRRDRAQAVVNAGTGPGLVGAGVLALVLLPDWRLGFAAAAVFTAVAGAAVLVLDRGAVAEPGAATQAAGVRRVRGSWRWTRALAVPATAALLLGAGSAAVWTYGRTQVIAGGAGETASTVAWVALGLGGTATVLTAGPLARVRPARAWLLTASAVAAAVAGLAVLEQQLVLALAACAVFGWGFVAATSALIAWAAELVPDRAAPGTALLFVTLVLGQAVGAVVVARTADAAGLGAAFGVAAGIVAVAALCGHDRLEGRTRAGRRSGRWRTTTDDRVAASARPSAGAT